MSLLEHNASHRTSTPFRYDTVGSFLRPKALKDARPCYQNGELTAEELRAVEDQEIIQLVQKQKEVGLKAVNYLEFDTERAGDFGPLRLLKDQQVVLGLFSPKTGELEEKDVIINRIKEAAQIVDLDHN